eukprot:TRINITY_DN11650_c0_g1_i1.p1 TRINITY_DN11650_c0_g1~~TRINITY_DN11650_c0_g1_i1.p1  ORF type:complete len:853 (+),score=171.82 TRINITY_DN11650_c0_g1_i1:83-2641(+)
MGGACCRDAGDGGGDSFPSSLFKSLAEKRAQRRERRRKVASYRENVLSMLNDDAQSSAVWRDTSVQALMCLLDVMPYPAVMWGEDGVIGFVNAQALQTFGHTPSTLRAQTPLDRLLRLPDDAPAAEAVEEMVEKELSGCWAVTGEGQQLPVSVHTTALEVAPWRLDPGFSAGLDSFDGTTLNARVQRLILSAAQYASVRVPTLPPPESPLSPAVATDSPPQSPTSPVSPSSDSGLADRGGGRRRRSHRRRPRPGPEADDRSLLMVSFITPDAPKEVPSRPLRVGQSFDSSQGGTAVAPSPVHSDAGSRMRVLGALRPSCIDVSGEQPDAGLHSPTAAARGSGSGNTSPSPPASVCSSPRSLRRSPAVESQKAGASVIRPADGSVPRLEATVELGSSSKAFAIQAVQSVSEITPEPSMYIEGLPPSPSQVMMGGTLGTMNGTLMGMGGTLRSRHGTAENLSRFRRSMHSQATVTGVSINLPEGGSDERSSPTPHSSPHHSPQHTPPRSPMHNMPLRELMNASGAASHSYDMYVVVDPTVCAVLSVSRNLLQLLPQDPVGRPCGDLLLERARDRLERELSEATGQEGRPDALSRLAMSAAVGDLSFVAERPRLLLAAASGSLPVDVVGAQPVTHRAVAIRVAPVGAERAAAAIAARVVPLSPRKPSVRFSRRTGVSDEVAMVVDAVSDPCLTVSLSGTITFANEAFGTVFETDHESAPGKDISSFVPVRLRTQHVQAVCRMLNAPKGTRRGMRRPRPVVGRLQSTPEGERDRLVPLLVTVCEICPSVEQEGYLVLCRVVPSPGAALRLCHTISTQVSLAGSAQPDTWEDRAVWHEALRMLAAAEAPVAAREADD